MVVRMINNKELFYKELNKLIENEKIQRLKEFPQHHGSNTLKHCIAVAKRSFALAEEFGWDIDEKELARSAMLHDYYLYKIKEQGLSAFKHGTSHPIVAIRNAVKDFSLQVHAGEIVGIAGIDGKAALLCLADKDIAIREFATPEVKRAIRLAKKIRKKKGE